MPSTGPSRLALSVLDQSPVSDGMTAGQALRNSIDLARAADRLGYTRYWVAEHHGTRMLACMSPEALIGPIGLATSRIRVGSGGVMLPHYSPLKVAETFRMLAALCPDRIDLGLGRAPGSDPLTAWALQRDKRQAGPDDFPEQLAELLAYIRDGLPPTTASRRSRRCRRHQNVRCRGCLVRLRRAASGPQNSACRMRVRRLHRPRRCSHRPPLCRELRPLEQSGAAEGGGCRVGAVCRDR